MRFAALPIALMRASSYTGGTGDPECQVPWSVCHRLCRVHHPRDVRDNDQGGLHRNFAALRDETLLSTFEGVSTNLEIRSKVG